MQRGYVRIYRMIEDSGLLQKPRHLALFLYLLIKAVWKPQKFATSQGIIHLKVGQVCTGREKLSRVMKQSVMQIRTCTTFLKKAEIITIETTNHYSIITIINYRKYQLDQPTKTTKTAKTQPAPNQHLTTVEALEHYKHLKDAREYFEVKFKNFYGNKPRPSKKALAGLRSLFEDGLTAGGWRDHVDTYFVAPWPAQKDLGGLLANWDKMSKPLAASAPGRGSKDIG